MESSIFQRLSEHTEFHQAIANQSEIGQVLITAAFFDNQLQIILRNFLVEGRAGKDLLEGMNAPIGTFSSRIQISYALGLLSDVEFKSIEAVRKIRNAFAHKISLSFDDASLTKHFNKLAWAVGRDEVENVEREQILMIASLILASQLTNRADHARASRLTARVWPIERVDVDPYADPLD